MAIPRGFVVVTAIVAGLFAGVSAGAVENTRGTQALAQARRPHVIIHPRRLEPGPNSRRICRFWLVRQDRLSGPVIVPQQYCWWN
jgi:hypothetical protein